MKYVLFFSPTECSIRKNIVNGKKWARILRAGTKASMCERNNRHIKMVAKLSFQPKEKEVPLVVVSTKFNKTGVEWKATLPFMPLLVALATKMSYNSQNYYHDWPVHYLATLSQFHNCLSVPFPSVFAGPDFICDNQSRLPCEILVLQVVHVFQKSSSVSMGSEYNSIFLAKISQKGKQMVQST